MRFGPLIWLTCITLPRKIRELGIYLFVAVDTFSRFQWVNGVKSKTSKACTDALEKIFATNRQRNVPKICSSRSFPEKNWADQGKEIAGNFSQFCKKNSIDVFYTGSKKKSAVAQRYVRTLNTIICKYLHEFDTNRYIDQLGKFVSIINNRINRLTKLAPITVSQKDVPYLVFLCNEVPPQQPMFKIGDWVRIWRKLEIFILVTGYNSLKNFSQSHTYLQKIPQHMSSKTWTTKTFKANSVSLNWLSLSVPHQQQPPNFSRVWTVFLIKTRKSLKNHFLLEEMVGFGGNDKTLNLISNASMETFPGNKLSSFTTLLTTHMNLSEDWQVALLEISWPA